MATDPPLNPLANDGHLEGAVYENPNDRRPIREFANLGQPGHRFGYIAQRGDNPNLKQTLIHLLGQSQFGGALNEDPHQHLAIFEEHCATFAPVGPALDALKLKCFHLSLKDTARSWLRTLNGRTTGNWEELQRAFLGKYFPPSKTQHFRTKITTFKQGEYESLTDAWDRWQDLLRMCPHHGIDRWLLFQFFYGGLNYPTKTQLNSAAGGNLANKDSVEPYSGLLP